MKPLLNIAPEQIVPVKGGVFWLKITSNVYIRTIPGKIVTRNLGIKDHRWQRVLVSDQGSGIWHDLGEHDLIDVEGTDRIDYTFLRDGTMSLRFFAPGRMLEASIGTGILLTIKDRP